MNRIISIIVKYKRILWSLFEWDIVKNVNKCKHEKKCLLIYLTDTFKRKEINDHHQNSWQMKMIAKVLDDRQYQVDAAHYLNKYTNPRTKYDLVIGLIPRSIDIYSRCLKPSSKIIAYLTSMNLVINDEAERERIAYLFERDGLEINPIFNSGVVSKEIEKFDGALLFGNEYTLKTYDEFKMPPTYYLINNGYEYSFEINHKKNPKKFLYFGSYGQIAKGLDLLLDVFSQNSFPCELYVCGRIDDEPEFKSLFYDKLYNTNNIHTYGFVDINSEIFEKIVNECAYSILPSSAEGKAGSVVTSMSAGMISIVSIESGYDAQDGIILLPDCRIETITKFVIDYSEKDSEWIEFNSKLALENARNNYSKSKYIQSLEYGLDKILL